MITQSKTALKSCTPGDPRQNFPKLAALIDYLASLNGRADLNVLSRHLAEINVTRDDVAPACIFGKRGYRRNLIAGNEWFELLALCWRSGHCTPIHDHQGVSCAFKVIHGTGTEIRFTKTPSGLICPAGVNTMPPGYICSADDADIHQVANMQPAGEDVVTLHIYSPRISKMNTYAFATSEGAECGDIYGGAPGMPKATAVVKRTRPITAKRSRGSSVSRKRAKRR